MIVASLQLDNLSKETIIKKLSALVESHLKGYPERIKFLKYLVNLDFQSITLGVVNETIPE